MMISRKGEAQHDAKARNETRWRRELRIFQLWTVAVEISKWNWMISGHVRPISKISTVQFQILAPYCNAVSSSQTISIKTFFDDLCWPLTLTI